MLIHAAHRLDHIPHRVSSASNAGRHCRAPWSDQQRVVRVRRLIDAGLYDVEARLDGCLAALLTDLRLD